jgi:hypothetical protein
LLHSEAIAAWKVSTDSACIAFEPTRNLFPDACNVTALERSVNVSRDMYRANFQPLYITPLSPECQCPGIAKESSNAGR